MSIIIRDERHGEEKAIAELTTLAFTTLAMASGTEAAIVDALRQAGALTLSLLAEQDGEIVGHVAFSPAVLGKIEGWYGLGPVSVRPDLHKQGIGSALIKAGLDRLRVLGASGCVVIGHPAYYPRFGFAANPRLTFLGEAGEHVMALSFGGSEPAGEVGFHPVFSGA
ncbi:MAG: N-acetyltransferase [Alphaproteobacteria bacterium]|nr:N-acetyltransferase [Alphaproteobacteria bacterium]